MYVYFDNTGTLKTQISHGDILRQGGDLKLTVCLDIDFAAHLGLEWTDLTISAAIKLEQNATYSYSRPGSLADEPRTFLKLNESEMTYDLIPGKQYKMIEFEWLHSNSNYAAITNNPGNIKIGVTLNQVERENEETPELTDDAVNILNTFQNGVITAFVEAVFGFVPGPTVDGSTEQYDALHAVDLYLMEQIDKAKINKVGEVVDAYESGELDGMSCFVVYGYEENDPSYTTTWTPGQSWIGIALRKPNNLPTQASDYTWSLFVGKSRPVNNGTNSSTVNYTLVNDTDYTYTSTVSPISTLNVTIPDTVTHGFYGGINVRNIGGALQHINITNALYQTYPLIMVLRGHKTNYGEENNQVNSSYVPAPSVNAVELLFYCDGIDIKCHIMES